MTDREKTDVKVYCQKCGNFIGYVVEDGHKEWHCETCSTTGKVTAINVSKEEE